MTQEALAALVPPAPEVEIRRAGDGDEERVLELIARTYPGDARARYAWLYRGNPHGRALTWLAVERASGALAGGTSMFPRRVLVEGRERTGSIGGDCYIDPSVRRRGIATALHRRSFAEMADGGVSFMYGPPVVANLRALLKAGSRAVAHFRRFARPLTGSGAYRAAFSRAASGVEARLAGLPIVALDWWHGGNTLGLSVERVREFGAEFDTLFERVAATHTIVCVRDRAYLTWRYLASPGGQQQPLAVRRRGELIGLIGLEVVNGHAEVIDFFTAAVAEAIDATLSALILYARRAGCGTVEVNLVQGSRAARRLWRFGFIPRPGRVFQVAAVPDDPQRRTLLTAAAWHFTEADQDLETAFGVAA